MNIFPFVFPWGEQGNIISLFNISLLNREIMRKLLTPTADFKETVIGRFGYLYLYILD